MALVQVQPGNEAEARRLQRLAGDGQLRRLFRGIYTDDLHRPLEAIVRSELLSLCALIAPGCVISHRSALEGQRLTAGGKLYLTGAYRRSIRLEGGISLRIDQGPGPMDSDIRVPTQAGDTWISSQARALLENLTQSRGAPAERRSLGRKDVEEWLDRYIGRDTGNAINTIRDQARAVAGQLGLEAQFEILDGKIGALLGTRAANLGTPAARARAAGRPYDGERIALFETLATALQRNPLHVLPVDPGADGALQAFVETYFSNYIEGTEFELDEAHRIVVQGRPIQYRDDDSHDILGTYRAILGSKQDSRPPASGEEFLGLLQHWNSQVIESRMDKRPGEIKTQRNRADAHFFVEPEMAAGTLLKGLEYIASGSSPANQAALAMFVVAEVRPFTDGNGRTARVAMNHYLSAAGLTRIIVPNVLREDYLSGLRALSTNWIADGYLRMLERAAAFSHWLDTSTREACFAALDRSNATKDPREARLVFG